MAIWNSTVLTLLEIVTFSLCLYPTDDIPPVNQPSHPHNSTPSSIWTPWCNSIAFSHVLLDSHEYMAATLSRRVKSIRRVWGGGGGGVDEYWSRPCLLGPHWACPGAKDPIPALEIVRFHSTIKFMVQKLQNYAIKTYGEWRYSSPIVDLDTMWRRVVSFKAGRFTYIWVGDRVDHRTGLDSKIEEISLTWVNLTFSVLV
jgi:hypothetical protein